MSRGSSSEQIAIATERRPTKRPRRRRRRERARSRNAGQRAALATRIWRAGYRSLLVVLALVVALIVALRFVDPPYTSFMAHARWDAWRRDEPITVQQQWIAYRDIPDVAKLAVIAAEDQRFATHRGFDLTQIADALGDARRGRRVRGASTITQQTAKNLFLWPGQSWLRKGVEAALTVLIEALWPKRRILEVYLNVAEFGTGTYGLEAAAQRYFGKDASRLNRYECALLAAVLPSPAQLRADSPTPYLRTRQNWILVQMNRVASLDGMAALVAQRP